jgi:hypothetical protein
MVDDLLDHSRDKKYFIFDEFTVFCFPFEMQGDEIKMLFSRKQCETLFFASLQAQK